MSEHQPASHSRDQPPQIRSGLREELRPRVLIVEDDFSVATGLIGALMQEGYDVAQSSTGEVALQHVAGAAFDVVVLDIGLPGMDGFEVLRRLRLEGQTMPVLILTARDAVGHRIQGLDLGADDYMTKPFSIPELAARIRALIRRGKAQSGQKVVHGPLVLDARARRATLKGEPLDLAAREWAVLEVLMARVEKIVSKEAIIQAMVGWEQELSQNAIEVYVSRLRAKLEPAGVRVRTVRGFGYMLEDYKAMPET